MTFRKGSNHHQNQEILQISHNLMLNWDAGIKELKYKEFPT